MVSAHAVSVVGGATASRQRPLVQSSSSAQSSSDEHFLGRSQAPALHLPPGPHSASPPQAWQVWSLQTLPSPQSSSDEHSGLATQTPAWQAMPSPQSSSVEHFWHCLLMQARPSLQSAVDSHAGVFGFLLGQPTSAKVATRVAATSRNAWVRGGARMKS